MSSFAQQYGIRLEQEKHSIKASEYRRLLIGLNGDTPLGYTVQTRAETDPKKISEMTAHQKEIRIKWQEFKNKNNKQSKIFLSNEDINKVMSSFFS